jgi:hypothetical protein
MNGTIEPQFKGKFEASDLAFTDWLSIDMSKMTAAATWMENMERRCLTSPTV